jgi:hypothetical protein
VTSDLRWYMVYSVLDGDGTMSYSLPVCTVLRVRWPIETLSLLHLMIPLICPLTAPCLGLTVTGSAQLVEFVHLTTVSHYLGQGEHAVSLAQGEPTLLHILLLFRMCLPFLCCRASFRHHSARVTSRDLHLLQYPVQPRSVHLLITTRAAIPVGYLALMLLSRWL